MTIVIDIARREITRRNDSPLIAFRRTESDRRPARPVIRPNDGPSQAREALDAKVRARLEQQAERRRQIAAEVLPQVDPAEGTNRYNARQIERANIRRRQVLRAIAEQGGDSVPLVGLRSGLCLETTRRVLFDMERIGWVKRAAGVNANNTRQTIATITDRGWAEIGGRP